MGKRIIPRARGKGGPRYRSPSHRYLGRVEYFPFGNFTGKVVDILHDPGRSAPVAIIKAEDGREILNIASEGLEVGKTIKYLELLFDIEYKRIISETLLKNGEVNLAAQRLLVRFLKVFPNTIRRISKQYKEEEHHIDWGEIPSMVHSKKRDESVKHVSKRSYEFIKV